MKHGPEACVTNAVVVLVDRRPRRISGRVHAQRWRKEQRFAGGRNFGHEHGRPPGSVGGMPDRTVQIGRIGATREHGCGHNARGIEFGQGHRKVAEHIGQAKAARRRPIQAEAVGGLVPPRRPDTRDGTDVMHVRRGAVDDEVFVIGQIGRGCVDRRKDPVHLPLTVGHHLTWVVSERLHARGQAAWQRQWVSRSVVGVEGVVPRQKAEACRHSTWGGDATVCSIVTRLLRVAEDQNRPVFERQGLNRVLVWNVEVPGGAAQGLQGLSKPFDRQDLPVGVKEWSEGVAAVLIADGARHKDPVFDVKNVGNDPIYRRLPIGCEGHGRTQIGGAMGAEVCVVAQFDGLGHWIILGQVEQMRAGIEATHRQSRHRRPAVSATKEDRGVPMIHRCWR